MNDLPKKRDISVDCVKGLAIIAVVFGHLGFYLPSLSGGIDFHPFLHSLWHVPVFFCVAVFFIKEERLIHPFEFIIKKVKTLYIKTILFVIIAVLFHNTLLNIGLYSEQLDYGGKTMFLYSTKDTIVTLLKAIFLMGREPIVGPLWFAHVLFIALCGYSLLAFFLSKILKYERNKLFWIRGIVILTLTIFSNILSQNYGITQNRLSNVFPAMLLIYIGQWLNVEKKLKYDSSLVAFTCFLLVVQSVLRSGGIGLNNNRFYDVFHLIVGGGIMTYLLLFFIKKINVPHMKNVLAFFGNYSFAIMGLHCLCFKLCIIISNNFFHTSFNIAAFVPNIKTQYIIGIFFLVLSCCIPAVLGFAFDVISNKVGKKNVEI